jgi:hypothetical protein
VATSVKTDLLLTRDPSSALHAVTKQYCDAGALDASRQPGYPMDQYGIIAASLAFDSIVSVASVTVTANTIEIYRLYVPANKLITGAVCVLGGAGVTPGSTNASGFALYTDDGATQSAITTNDYTLFTSTGLRSKAFNSTVAAQTTGRFMRLAMIHTCATSPKFGAGTAVGSAVLNAMAPSGTHRRGVFATSTTAFPASFTASTFGTLDSPPLFLGLY